MIDSAKNRADMRIIVVGAGMSGLLAGIELQKAGYTNFVIYEKADKVAGTWRENRYPGLTCDIPSHAYTYSFAPNPDWTQRYPPGPEIFAYFARVTEEFGLNERIVFNKEVTSAVFEDGGWTVGTADGASERADAMIVATGILHHPNIPTFEGQDSFKGPIFHSARWDESVELDGKRIGVIGSGSTGVQIVSALADRASKLVHFQRTPQWITPGQNPQFTEEQRAAFRANPQLMIDLHDSPELKEGLRMFTRAVTDVNSPEMAAVEAFTRMNLENNVQDPVLREKLRPNYRAACKRMIISMDYYEKVQLPAVEVVREKIDRFEANGIRTADGEFHELDIIVLATGFKASSFMRPMNVVGRDGVELNKLWDKRPSAYLAVSIPDFPNFFMLNGPSAPFGNLSSIAVAEYQMMLVMKLLEVISSGNARQISVSREAMATYNSELIAATKGTVWASGCSSWYLDPDGVPTIWPYTLERFMEETSEPKLDAFERA
ncbi:flavin-containing monooxygenase [Sphingomonas crocodyli]|uniref:NAD(P)/FAD-dependent oxidoreductase n=1 Tax=Sphingomonas crocodyli TaxID=1979270 RepID=A0A437M9I9_9SPHN|nr:NAD(P)/FAD-dependent oxidoreductase [Sphingomonas crocodyli]RVT94174.1 NAD(P)/FAD-dependent oxidoreductase [Sphingomonas crocodyli]